MEAQYRSARDKAAALSAEQYAYAAAHPDMLPDNPRFFTERSGELDSQLAELRQRIKELQAQLASLDDVEKSRATRPASTWTAGPTRNTWPSRPASPSFSARSASPAPRSG